MNVKSSLLLCALLVAGLVFCAGCMSARPPEDTSVSTPSITTAGTPVAGVPVPLSLETVTSTVPATIPAPVMTTWIQKSYGYASIDDPQIVLLSFDKNNFGFTIPDCAMREIFPQAANDTKYGIHQRVPKLIALSKDQITIFTRGSEGTNTENPNRSIESFLLAGSWCSGVPAYPTWNLVRIDATLIPRNGNPADYEIGINIKYHDTVIEQFRIDQTLIIDQPVFITRYVPLKTEEMDSFDRVELVFSKKT
jgi:hypothetical protein